jgi:type VI secretion system protein ImpA
MPSVEELLAPVSTDAPCGDDLSYDPALAELQRLLKGKPETQFSSAEEPNWRDVRQEAEKLFSRSKDLRIAVPLCLAWLKAQGLPGFRDGVLLLRGMLERYWSEVYPRLDPEDNNDPTERVSILSALTTPLGTFGDPLRFVEQLQKAPVTNSVRAGSYSLDDILKAQAPGGSSEPGASGTAQIQASFRDTDPAVLQQKADAVAETKANVKAIDEFLVNVIGSNKAPEWTVLLTSLDQLHKAIVPYLPGAAAGVAGESGTQEGAAESPQGGGDGVIRSRSDVVRALENICGYYARSEPSSPLPFLLRRAQRMVEMDFLQIINDLTPETLANLQTIVGVQHGESGASSGEPPEG